MKSFRNTKYLDRYEDVVFDLEQTLDTAPANNAHQTKTGLIINNSRQQTGHFRITNAISKSRHVFVFGIDTARIDSQTANPFLYDTFDLPNNANIRDCHLEVANGNG